MRIAGALLWGGLTASAISFGMEGASSGFEYAAITQGTFLTQPAFRQAAEQTRDFRDALALTAVVQLAGSGAIYGSAGIQRRSS